MCCCGKSVVNGQDGYSWDGKSFGVRKPWFPELKEGDELLRELPGRCGGSDSHSFDLRIVRQRFHGPALLVHSGLGDTRINLHAYGENQRAIYETLDDDTLYWLMVSLYHVQSDAATEAAQNTEFRWRTAAATGKLKTRKVRNQNFVKVWIEA